MEVSEAPPFLGNGVWKKANYFFSCTRKVIEYLEKHFDTPMDLGKMAEVACMEKHAFSKSSTRRGLHLINSCKFIGLAKPLSGWKRPTAQSLSCLWRGI
jgi:hypothetical protein